VNLDIYTFAFALGIVYSIQIVIFFHEYQYHKNLKGPGWWLLWSAASVAAFLSMVLRQVKSIEHIALFTQNVMFILAAIFVYVGIMRFLGKRPRLNLQLLVIVIFGLPLSYYTFAEDNIQIRSILLFSAVVIGGSIAVYDLHRGSVKSVRTALNLCIFIILFHVFHAAIKVTLLLTGSRIESLNSQDFFNTSGYIEILIVSIFLPYALIMMINQRLRHEIDKARDHFEIIFNTTPDAIIITDLIDGKIISVNRQFFNITGYHPDQVLGRTTRELNLWKNIEERKDFISMMQMQGKCTNYEADFRRSDQTIIPSLISSQLMNINEVPHIISIIRDISELKLREKEILSQNNQLKISNLEKDKFFSIIAHDLKGPFSSFLGLSEIMAEEIPHMPISEVIKIAAIVRDSARNVFSLLNNLLEWSLIKQGTSNFLPVLTSLLAEVNECINIYAEIGKGKRISLNNLISPKIMVYVDQNMLLSLIRNLLSNAIKFTPEGGSVTIAAVLLEDHSCLISVTDTGIGISGEMKKQLFRIDSNTSRAGTNGEASCGLGLLLCKEFVDKHQGKIWVESKEGEGSTFFVRLPGESA